MSVKIRSKELIVLTADKNTEFALKGLLSKRARSFGIRSIAFDIFVHPERDPGCLRRAADFLRPYSMSYGHALVIFDREGCGQERRDAAWLERQAEQALSQSGWGDRAAVVVPDPELEIWAWSDSPHVERALGWGQRSPGLRAWLVASGRLEADASKPKDPKEAVEEALRVVRKPRSSSLYMELASSVGFEACTDPAFGKLRSTLARWFPAEG